MVDINSTSLSLGLVDGSKLKGQVRIVMKDELGNIIEDTTVHNNIVIGIRNPIIKLLAGLAVEDPSALPFISTLKLGSSDKAVSIEDTDLNEPIENSAAKVVPPVQISADGLRATFAFAYAASDQNINFSDTNKVYIREMGLFTNDGTMVAHTVVGEWQKKAGVYLEVYWTIGYAVQNG